MSAHSALVLLVVVLSCAVVDSRPWEDSVNVGTVLFSPNDFKKTHWHKSEIALLQARTIFQRLIPPSDFIDPNTDYIDKLLRYFRDAYMAIKSEAKDPVLDSIMTTALSDTIGGYLKLWILPVTKFSFYGGTVSYDNAFKIFNFYDEIKKYLVTDGSGWRAPDDTILNSISVSIPRAQRDKLVYSRVRCSTDPCDNFAYFERNGEGFTIPLPTVNWADNTMFVPIKNESFVSLNSPRYHNALNKYYLYAKHCLETRNINASTEFDERFQMWLNEDIVPHLMDEDLYVALGSVLNLVNRSQVAGDCANDPGILSYLFTKLMATKELFCCTSKKVWLISVILLLEIIWCAFAIKHTCFEKKKKMPGCDNLTLYFKSFRDNSRSKKSSSVESSSIDLTEDKKHTQIDSAYSFKHYNGGSYADVIGGGLKIHKKPRSRQTGIQVPSQGAGPPKETSTGVDARSHTSISSRISSNDAVTIVNEVYPQNSRICSQNVALNNKPKTSSSEIKTIGCCYHECNCKCNNDSPEEQEDTITLFRKNQRSIERAMFESEEDTSQLRRAISEFTKLRNDIILETAKASGTGGACCKGNNFVCSCNCPDCIPDPEVQHEYGITCMTVEPQNVFGKKQTETVTQTPDTKLTCVDQQTESKKEIRKAVTSQKVDMRKVCVKKKEVKKSSRKQYLEIKIDRPRTEIKVGISGMGSKCSGLPQKSPTRYSSRKSVKSEKEKNEKNEQSDNSGYSDVTKESQNDLTENKTPYKHENSCLILKSITGFMEKHSNKNTQEQSIETAPSLIEADRGTRSKYEEQASGSHSFMPYVDTASNTSGRHISAFASNFNQAPSQAYMQRFVDSNAAPLHVGSSPQKLIAPQQNTNNKSQNAQVPDPVQKSSNLLRKIRGKHNDDKLLRKKGDVKDSCPSKAPQSQEKKIKKRIPGAIPKYLRQVVEKKAKQSIEQADKPAPGESEMDTKTVYNTKRPIQTERVTVEEKLKFNKEDPIQSSSPTKMSPSSSMKSTSSRSHQSPDNSIKCVTMTQYNHKNTEDASKSPRSVGRGPTPGIPLKTKIPVSPGRILRAPDKNQIVNREPEVTDLADSVDTNSRSKDSIKTISKEPDHISTATITKKRSTASFSKYSKRSAMVRAKPATETKTKKADMHLMHPSSFPRKPQAVTEAQKVITDVLRQADCQANPKPRNVKQKSYIPKLKSYVAAADDTHVATKTNKEAKKLNVTL